MLPNVCSWPVFVLFNNFADFELNSYCMFDGTSVVLWVVSMICICYVIVPYVYFLALLLVCVKSRSLAKFVARAKE